MIIELLRNKETSLVLEDVGRVIAVNGFMAQGYRKAVDTLSTYVAQTQELRRELAKIKNRRSEVNNMLCQSPQNIIAFSGKRGSGKTSSMMSFSEFLEKPAAGKKSKELKEDKLPGLRVTALSPLDPTMLENDQDVLSVVLSRLLYKAEERWEGMNGFHGDFRGSEEEKNQLLKTGNACMNGITAIKRKGEMKSLADLQRIGDSAVLKKDLYDFVNQVITFCLDKGEKESCKDYLVIPIDDTDCQIRKAYEVMEDIRRYLTLPNVIILMATDVELLRTVVAQHFADEFKTGIDKSFRRAGEMEQLAEKYLTKLIPTSHRIYLPSFESLIRENSEGLALGYYEDAKSDVDLITGTDSRDRVKLKDSGVRDCLDFDFQSKILHYIYKKTGIVFIEHASYVNNIIPTTMRGLSHLMGLLYGMPLAEKDEIPVNVTPEELVGIVERKLAKADHNLDVFKEYFMNEWVPTKVGGGMVRILSELDRQVEENRIKYAYDEIYYSYIESEAKVNSGYGHIPEANYYNNLELLGAINGTISSINIPKEHKSMADYYNLMAVRILLTIKNNKYALKLRQKAVDDLEREWKKNPDAPLIFDIDILGVDDSFPRIKEQSDTVQEEYIRNLEPVISVFRLYLTDRELWKGRTQYDIYKLQEFSWRIMCNWDLQDAAYKAVRRYFKTVPADEWTEEGLIAYICEAVCAKNCGMLQEYREFLPPEMEKWPESLTKLLETERKKAGKTSPEEGSSQENSPVSSQPRQNSAEDQEEKGKEPSAAKSLEEAVMVLEGDLDKGADNVGQFLQEMSDLERQLQNRIGELEKITAEDSGLATEAKKEIYNQIGFLRTKHYTCQKLRSSIEGDRALLEDSSQYAITPSMKGQVRRLVKQIKAGK